MAFRKKYHKIMELSPDILILIECEGKATLAKTLQEYPVKSIQWFGDHPHKGIAVILFINAKLELFQDYEPDYKFILPFTLSLASQKLSLFVIWAMPNKERRKEGYVGQIWKAINYYQKSLNEASILIGDFNSNAIWDKERKEGNHSQVVEFLANYKIYSLYHKQSGDEHGKEAKPTWFMYRHQDKTYHLDYCFASLSCIGKSTSLTIGDFEEWIAFSDHMPLIVKNIIG